MLRSRPLQTLFSRLACVAVLLMLCAPLLSRVWQSPAASRWAELCTAQGLREVALVPALPVSPADHAPMHAGARDAASGVPAAHAGDAACVYCLLAMRWLPLLAVVLCVLSLARAVALRTDVAARRLPDHRWPAHPARGPPLAA